MVLEKLILDITAPTPVQIIFFFLFLSIVYLAYKAYIFFKNSKDEMNKFAIFIILFFSFLLLLDYLYFSNGEISISDSIYNFVAVLTLAFLIIFNNRIIKIQDEVKKIQSRETLIHEQELNLKLTPFLERQNREIYSPLVDLLKILKFATSYDNIRFMVMTGYYDPILLKSNLDKILENKKQMNQTDLKKVEQINEIVKNVVLKNIFSKDETNFDSQNQDEINKLKFKTINDFIMEIQLSENGFELLSDELKKNIERMESLDLFKKYEYKGEERISFNEFNENNLIFEKGSISVDQNILLDHEKGKYVEKYTSEDLIPLLSKYFEDQCDYFIKIKMEIEKKVNDTLPYDVSKFADEN
jgi:hypothetical protein